MLTAPTKTPSTSAAKPSSSMPTTTDQDMRIMNSRKLGAFNAERLDEFTPSEKQQLNIQRGLVRREIVHNTMYAEQTTYGRPHTGWSMCGNDECKRGKYVERGILTVRAETFVAPRSTPGDAFSDFNFMPATPVVDVAPRFEIFIHNVVKDQFQTPSGTSLHKDLCRQVRSFSDSPPVRSALYNFRTNLERAKLDPSPRALANLFTELRGACIYMVKLERFCGARNFPWIEKEHQCFKPAGQRRPKYWELEEFVLEFCTILEAWRRYARRNIAGTDWRFMRPSVTADFYLCLLLNEWCMLKNGQLYDEHYTAIHMVKVWDDWFKNHARVDLAEVERDNMALQEGTKEKNREAGEGYVVAGIGQQGQSWQSARLQALAKARRAAAQQPP